jgi:tetratricopeptide (TPR) repeat protein
MTVPKSGVRAILIFLFAAAVWIRLQSAGLYPYYHGESATNFRHTSLISKSGSLPATDDRTWWPEGYSPARVGPNGVEYLTGYAFRVVSLFSDISEKNFAGRLSIFVFSLSVFTFYAFTQKLWLSRAAGLFAAFLIAFSGPLIAVTHGREFTHGPFSIVLISLHLLFLLGFLRNPTLGASLLASGVAFALLATSEIADLYLVLTAVTVVLAAGPSVIHHRRFLLAHLVVMVFAGVLLPHLRAERFLLGWPLIFVLLSTGYLFAKSVLPARIPGWVYIIATTAAITLVAKTFTVGGIDKLSYLEYWLYRFRFAFGKPDDPNALTDAARFIWTHAHSHPSPYTILVFFLPLLFLVPPVITSLRHLRSSGKTTVWPPIALAAFGTALFLLDRSAVFAAVLFLYPLVAISARSINRHVRTRVGPIAVAALLILMQSLPVGKANAIYHLASSFGFSTAPSDGFLWVSIGNADQELVRHLLTRSSVGDTQLAPPTISSLMTAFAGRKTILTPGVFTVEAMERTDSYMSKYYDHEDELFAVCDSEGIKYVLYSIDLLLDTSDYSPRYYAGISEVDKRSLAYEMHFEPQNLKHFNLVYQNDNYRLFRVTKEMEPFFLTDHPPVYQKSVLDEHGDDLGSFYESIVDVLLTYQGAVRAQALGNNEEAVRRYRYCLEKVPRFTRAWLGAGDALFRLDDLEAANAAYLRALQISPDHPMALYNTALTQARMGNVDEAIGLLDVLISSESDRDLVNQAKELKSVLERGIPLDGS